MYICVGGGEFVLVSVIRVCLLLKLLLTYRPHLCCTCYDIHVYITFTFMYILHNSTNMPCKLLLRHGSAHTGQQWSGLSTTELV